MGGRLFIRINGSSSPKRKQFNVMKIKQLLTVIAFFSCTSILGQEKIWITQAKMSDVVAFEKQINPNPKVLSQNESLSKDYYPLADKYQVTNPLIVQREPIGYLPVYAEYYYTPEDSILRLVSYDWEKDRYGNFFDKQKIWQKESKGFDKYNQEYERIKTLLAPQLGNPTTTDTKAKENASERGTYYTRETVWETEDLHASLSMIFESMTSNRVRFTLYWKR